MNTQKQLNTTLRKLANTLPSEQSQQCLLRTIDNYLDLTNDSALFEEITTQRLIQLSKSELSPATGNLFYTFTSPEMALITEQNEIPGSPDFYPLLEKAANRQFGDILACWTMHRIFRIKRNTPESFGISLKNKTASHISGEQNFHAELIHDIENDQRPFLTHFSDKPLRLSDANVLINLETFVKQQQWYEMLYDLELSATGEHIIMYETNEQGEMTLLSSARIQRWTEKDKWLAFDPFFQSNKWTLCVTDEKIRCLEKSGAFTDELVNKVDTTTPESMDRTLSENVVSGESMCELIRMAVSGPRERMNKIFFLTMKSIILLLKSSRLDVVYIITEQPAILNFFQSVNQSRVVDMPYIPLSYQQVNSKSPVTYKGFFLSQEMGHEIMNCSFRDYYKKIIAARKHRELAHD